METYTDYLKSLYALDSQEAKSKLNTSFSLNKDLLSEFKGIERQIQSVLALDDADVNSETITDFIAQIEQKLSILGELSSNVDSLKTKALSVTYKDSIIKQSIYIKEKMPLQNVSATSESFSNLLKENDKALLREKEEVERRVKEKEEAKRKEAAEQKRKEKEEQERQAKVEANKKVIKEAKDKIITYLGFNYDLIGNFKAIITQIESVLQNDFNDVNIITEISDRIEADIQELSKLKYVIDNTQMNNLTPEGESLVTDKVKYIKEKMQFNKIYSTAAEYDSIIDNDKEKIRKASKWYCGYPNPGDITAYLFNNGDFVVRGKGQMADFADHKSVPWVNSMNKIRNVIFCNGIENVGAHAFDTNINISSQCYSLTLAPSVIAIGDSAFHYCLNLHELSLEHISSIGNYSFKNCSHLTSVSLNSLSHLGVCAFKECIDLTFVTFGKYLSEIKREAFAYCNIRNLSFGNTINKIEAKAFYGNKLLQTVSINNPTPPKLEENSFGEFWNMTLKVTADPSVMVAYKNSYVWKDFGSIEIMS